IDILDETAFDIAIILSNILDNAIENIYENDRRISIKIRQTKYFLDIVVVNTTGINVLKKNPMLFTTKMDKNDHGLGIRSVRRYVSKLNGTIHFSQEGHEFKSWVSIPCENILD
ncbi:GHKL domain-containing protein, partial [Anaerorhabdus sp.]